MRRTSTTRPSGPWNRTTWISGGRTGTAGPGAGDRGVGPGAGRDCRDHGDPPAAPVAAGGALDRHTPSRLLRLDVRGERARRHDEGQ